VTAIAVGPEDVFAADAINKVVRHYDKSGNLLQSIGPRSPAELFRHYVPSPYFDILIAPDGLLRVVNPGGTDRGLYFTGSGMVLGKTVCGTDGFSGCCNPIAFPFCRMAFCHL